MVTSRTAEHPVLGTAGLETPVLLPAGTGVSSASPAGSPAAPLASPIFEERTLESRELLAGGREVRIRHGADFYRLRVTQNGKLILQK
jgi:hemin uptake protein HemP